MKVLGSMEVKLHLLISLNGGEWLSSLCGCFASSGKSSPLVRRVMGLRAVLDIVEK
jgi:hypothetical protein